MSASNDGNNGLPLSTLVEHVRGEIRRMIDLRDGKMPKLEIQEVSLEVNFVVEQQRTLSGEAEGSLAVLALTTNAEKSHRIEHVHKIGLTLKVLEPDAPVSTKRADAPSEDDGGGARGGGGGGSGGGGTDVAAGREGRSVPAGPRPVTVLPGTKRPPSRHVWLFPFGGGKDLLQCEWGQLEISPEAEITPDSDYVMIPLEKLKSDPVWKPGFSKYLSGLGQPGTK